jgi:spore coat protein U-like protein
MKVCTRSIRPWPAIKRSSITPLITRPFIMTMFIVAASVVEANQCNLTAVGVSFGNYNVFSGQDTDVTGAVTVSCQSAAMYSISLSPGFGSFTGRRLTNGIYQLGYNLFTDPQRLTIWGDGSGGTAAVSGSGTGGTYTVFGRIPAGQNAYVGSYNDMIVVTVTY